MGIDLANDGVTLNTPGGPHSGPNDLQNDPVLTSATSDSTLTTIVGTFNSTPNATFRIELFSNGSADPSGYGQGQTYLGFINVTTDGSGNAIFSATFTTVVPAGQVISATATDPNGNTSEFAQDLTVSSGAAPETMSPVIQPRRSTPPPSSLGIAFLLDHPVTISLPPYTLDEATLADLANDLIRARQRQRLQTI